MYEFTKEELQIIHLDMTIYVNKTPMLKESPSHKELRDKIQSMIDNYCNHDSIKTINPGDTISICTRCERVNFHDWVWNASGEKK